MLLRCLRLNIVSDAQSASSSSVPAHVEIIGFLQNIFHANLSLVHCGRCSLGWCANFAAPSKRMSVLRSVGYLLLEGELPEDGVSCREDEKSPCFVNFTS